MGCASNISYFKNRNVASTQDREIYQVGEVKTSLLNPDEFQDKYGDVWVLMDGREVDGSDFMQLTSLSSIPDARGKFLRMINHGANGENYDVEDREPGSYQKDALRSHDHKTEGEFTGVTSGSWNQGHALGYQGRYNTKSATTGGKETRPKNIGVNFYIKINACSSTEGICL